MSGTGILQAMARNVVDAIEQRVKEEYATNFSGFSSEICMGADGTMTQHIDMVAEQVALDIIGDATNVLSEEAGYIDNGRATGPKKVSEPT